LEKYFIYCSVSVYMYVQVGLKVVMMSPGFVYEPYSPREPIPFWKRLGITSDFDFVHLICLRSICIWNSMSSLVAVNFVT
jgi:hypothetical protein